MFDQWQNILLISSHTDDAELAMGGTINRLVNAGYNLFHLILSDAKEQAKLRGYKPNILRNECKKANEVLGLKPMMLHVYGDYPVNHFNKHRQSIADMLYKYKMAFKPDVVFVNSSFDTHQDHQVTFHEAVRIFKDIGILGYEFPYNNLSFDYDMIVGLTETNMEIKLDACSEYVSQQDRAYFSRDAIRAVAKVNALRTGGIYPYAEAFEVVRLIW